MNEWMNEWMKKASNNQFTFDTSKKLCLFIVKHLNFNVIVIEL